MQVKHFTAWKYIVIALKYVIMTKYKKTQKRLKFECSSNMIQDHCHAFGLSL